MLIKMHIWFNILFKELKASTLNAIKFSQVSMTFKVQ